MEWQEMRVPRDKGKFWSIIVVEKEPKYFKAYLSVDGENYTLYDKIQREDWELRDALWEFILAFDPGPFLIFPAVFFTRKEVIEQAPEEEEAFRREPKFVEL